MDKDTSDLKKSMRSRFPYEKRDIGHSTRPSAGGTEYTGKGAGTRMDASTDPRVVRMKCGGKVKKMAGGGAVRGTGCASKGCGKGRMR